MDLRAHLAGTLSILLLLRARLAGTRLEDPSEQKLLEAAGQALSVAITALVILTREASPAEKPADPFWLRRN